MAHHFHSPVAVWSHSFVYHWCTFKLVVFVYVLCIWCSLSVYAALNDHATSQLYTIVILLLFCCCSCFQVWIAPVLSSSSTCAIQCRAYMYAKHMFRDLSIPFIHGSFSSAYSLCVWMCCWKRAVLQYYGFANNNVIWKWAFESVTTKNTMRQKRMSVCVCVIGKKCANPTPYIVWYIINDWPQRLLCIRCVKNRRIFFFLYMKFYA